MIGCGQFMSRQHIPTIHRSEHLQLQHLVTRDAAKAQRVGAQYGAKNVGTRWEDVIADPGVDVVVVGVVPELHPVIARASLEAGKPTYVEKPLASTTAECLAIQRRSAELGVALAVGFNRRFAPAVTLVAGALRDVEGPVTLTYRISDDDRIRPPEQRWKLGCRLQIEVVHIFDLLFHLLQSEPVSVYARETRFNDALVVVEFADGSRASVHSSSWGSMAQPKERLEAVLDRGALEMEDFVELRGYGAVDLPDATRFPGRAYDGCDNAHVSAFGKDGRSALLDLRRRYNRAYADSGVLADSSDPQAWDRARQLLGTPPPPQINYSMDKGWGRALEDFCLAVADGRPIKNATAVDGVRATACAEAARVSIDQGTSVELDPNQWLLPA